jgi:hypothetical protein
MTKKNTGARWARSWSTTRRGAIVPTDRFAIESARYLKRKNPTVEVAVRDLDDVEQTVIIPPQPPQVRR